MLAEEAIVLSSYDDGTGTLTIGAGHTAAAGDPEPQRGMKISLTEAVNIYRNDIVKVEREVARAVRVSLTQNQFDALVSWHFNTGAISNATLTAKLNSGDVAGAATEFARWNKSKGKVLDGLISRRARETDIFLSGNYGSPVLRVLDSKEGHEEHFDAAQIEALLGGTARTEEEQTTDELLANPNSRLLPAKRPQQSGKLSRAALAKFIELVPEDARRNAVTVLAVRGYYLNSMGKEAANDRGCYDDAIFVITPEEVFNFNANTDPSRYDRGIAQLKSRQAVRYRPGLHGFSRKDGPYPAFRQDSNITVIRDEKGEESDSPDHRFWINLHRGGVTTTSSLGCQTVPPHQWNEFKTLVDKLLQQYGQETFFYILIDERDLPKEEITMAGVTSQPTVAGTAVTQDVLALVKSLSLSGAATPEELNSLKAKLAEFDASREVILKALLQAAQSDPLTSARDPELTPINGALGKTIGKALDGRKTAIGIIGMLATSILPIFFPQLAPFITAAEPLVRAATGTAAEVSGQTASWLPREIVSAAYPVFAAMTFWGGAGKIEKWVRALRDATAVQS